MYRAFFQDNLGPVKINSNHSINDIIKSKILESCNKSTKKRQKTDNCC